MSLMKKTRSVSAHGSTCESTNPDAYLFNLGFAFLALSRIILTLSPAAFVRRFGEFRDIFDEYSAMPKHHEWWRKSAKPFWADIQAVALDGDDVDHDDDAMMRAIEQLLLQEPHHTLFNGLREWIQSIDQTLVEGLDRTGTGWRKSVNDDRNWMLDAIGKTGEIEEFLDQTSIEILKECRRLCDEADAALADVDASSRHEVAGQCATFARLLSQKQRQLWPAIDQLIERNNRVQHPATSETAEMAPASEYYFKHSGDLFAIRFEDESGSFKSRKGLELIHQLLTSPKTPISTFDLQGVPTPRRPRGDHGGEVMDAKTRAQLQARLDQLPAEITEAEDSKMTTKAGELKEELENINSRLRCDSGFGGRSRSFSKSPQAKSIDAVRKNLGRAYEGLSKANRPMHKLVEHLKSSVKHDGDAFVYRPDRQIEWDLG
jgi:hypothetical protein